MTVSLRADFSQCVCSPLGHQQLQKENSKYFFHFKCKTYIQYNIDNLLYNTEN